MKRNLILCLTLIVIFLGGAFIEKSRPDDVTTVVVERGDTLWEIAEKINPGMDPRRVINHMVDEEGHTPSTNIQPGDHLLVPVWY